MKVTVTQFTFTTVMPGSMEEVEAEVRQALADEKFSVLTEIDPQAKIKEKVDEDIGAYRILGACSAKMAHKAIQAEPRVGVMLPCNVILRQVPEGVEVSAVDPVASMKAIENAELETIALEVGHSLKKVIDKLGAKTAPTG
jgi:uncharacterized protein (DUF302 family)